MAGMDTDEQGGGTDVLDRELEKLLEEEQLDEGDHDRYSHYVKKDKILERAQRKTGEGTVRQEVDSRS